MQNRLNITPILTNDDILVPSLPPGREASRIQAARPRTGAGGGLALSAGVSDAAGGSVSIMSGASLDDKAGSVSVLAAARSEAWGVGLTDSPRL